MAACCRTNPTFDGMSVAYRRRLLAVIVINAVMFVVEMIAGHLAKSQALQADALDFLGDTLTYALSLAVIGAAINVRANAALVKGFSLAVVGLWVSGAIAYRAVFTAVPQAEVMGVVGAVALAANLLTVLLLVSYRNGDANVRSVWLCSRNDVIGNIAVMFAAVAVWGSATPWPDLAVAAIMAALFLTSATQIVRQAMAEKRAVAA